MSEAADSSLDSAAMRDRIRCEQIRTLYRDGPVGVLAAFVAGLLLVLALANHGGVGTQTLVRWLMSVVIIVVAHCSLCVCYRLCRPTPPDLGLWTHGFLVASLADGLAWGLGSIWLRGSGDAYQELLVILVIAVVTSGSMFSFGTYLPAFFTFFLSAIIPVLLWNVVAGDSLHGSMALLIVLFIAAFSVLAWLSNANLVKILRLRFENADLAADLRQQKERAEQANLDKSRFLAAASHDLRQPVHALGLFVGALREREMDAEARRLVEHIDGSVQAMGGLFSALLDISELDAGVVKCAPRPFLIGPLLERIQSDHLTEATLKGLELRTLPCAAAVDTDPALLERILRNIVTNAVRYTDRGHVLIRCRHKKRLRIQVWDSGRGIPREQRELVFREYYQIGNPERDRAKGLGLGLAIVRRLTGLIDCPLSLQSRPGRGSVFTVAVPIADGAPLAAAPLVPEPVAAPGQGLILVVDDEAAIRQAMGGLLADWGYTVITAASGAEMVARTASCMTRPDLLICDYRLRGEETGIVVIERLRSEYNEDIPAMLITGDTAPDRLREARQSGLMLLHKPVSNRDLHKAIAMLTAASDSQPLAASLSPGPLAEAAHHPQSVPFAAPHSPPACD